VLDPIGIAGGIRRPLHRRAALLRRRSAQKCRHAKDIEGPQHQLHQGDGHTVAGEACESDPLPFVGADAHGNDVGRGPDQGGIAPMVAPNIMAMKTGTVAAGQSVKPAAKATSGTASAATR
jgi:hypothetical protein